MTVPSPENIAPRNDSEPIPAPDPVTAFDTGTVFEKPYLTAHKAVLSPATERFVRYVDHKLGPVFKGALAIPFTPTPEAAQLRACAESVARFKDWKPSFPEEMNLKGWRVRTFFEGFIREGVNGLLGANAADLIVAGGIPKNSPHSTAVAYLIAAILRGTDDSINGGAHLLFDVLSVPR